MEGRTEQTTKEKKKGRKKHMTRGEETAHGKMKRNGKVKDEYWFHQSPQFIQSRNFYQIGSPLLFKHTHLSISPKPSTAQLYVYFLLWGGGGLITTSQTRIWCKTQVDNRSHWVASADMSAKRAKKRAEISSCLFRGGYFAEFLCSRDPGCR